MQRLLPTLALAMVAACGGGQVDPGFYGGVTQEPAEAGADRPSKSDKPIARRAPASFERPKLVVIRAGWCPICRQVEPSVMSAYESYRGKVDLVVLDVSDDAKVSQALADATDQGVRAFFEKYGARTPTVGIFVQPEKGRLVHGELSDPATTARELENAVAQFGPSVSRSTPDAPPSVSTPPARGAPPPSVP